jgi:hypothetical protein
VKSMVLQNRYDSIGGQETTTHPSSHFSLLKAIGLFMGATLFAYLFSIFLHELGHYLVSALLDVPENGIVLNPFGKNYNIYLGDLTTAFGTSERRIASGLAGAMFDLLVSVVIGLALWRKRSPGLLPLLAMGSIALIHESANMAMGALRGYGDWSELSEVGVPYSIVILLAVILLVVGCIWMLQLLPLTGISPSDPFWRKLAVFLAGMPLLMLCSVVFLTLFWADVYVPTHHAVTSMDVLRMDKVIFMIASTALSVIFTLLHKPLLPWLDRISHTPVAKVRGREVLIAIGLGLAIVNVQLVFFKDPGAVMIAVTGLGHCGP